MKTFGLAALFAFAVGPIISKWGEYCPPPCKDVCTTCCNTGYIFAYGGVAFMEDHDVSSLNNVVITSEYDFGDTFIVGAGAGVRSDAMGGIRFEFEGLWSESDAANTTVVGVPGNFDTDLKIQALLVNILKEIPLDCGLTAFAGAGGGFANVDYQFDVPGVFAQRFTSEDNVLAFQAIAGAEMAVTDCLSVFGAYKMLYISEQEYSIANQPFDGDAFLTHNIVFGVRVGF